MIHRTLLALVIALVVCGCSSNPQVAAQLSEEDKIRKGDIVSKVEQRIRNIENGLVEFTTPMDMFQPESIKTKNLKTLSERMAYYKVPGVSMAVINDNRIAWAKGYGVIKAGSDTPVTTETLFEAASSTKLLTSAIALRLVEQGRLDLDEDVNKQLKSWRIPENDFTQQHEVTLRLLLTHQSGLNRPDGGFDWENESVPSLVQVLKGEAPARNEAAVLEYVPGTKWQYSNIGYVMIQLLLEDVVGKSFAQIAQENVFGPVGMKSSTLVYPLNVELKK
ncbi:MAG: serine hydrolase domain-containing protein, partial [Anaerolineae bacterium]